MLVLRSLNPQTERELFEQAYRWRSNRRSRLQPDRMPYEQFAADDPSQIVLGLFNGELQAVYLFSQISPAEFEAHFTSSRKANRRDVLAGARTIIQWFRENQLEIVAHVLERNTPLRRFLEEAGLSAQGRVTFAKNNPCQNGNGSDRLTSTDDIFVKYGVQVNPNRVKQQKTDDTGHNG